VALRLRRAFSTKPKTTNVSMGRSYDTRKAWKGRGMSSGITCILLCMHTKRNTKKKTPSSVCYRGCPDHVGVLDRGCQSIPTAMSYITRLSRLSFGL